MTLLPRPEPIHSATRSAAMVMVAWVLACGIIGAGLQEQHRSPGALGEACRQHTTGRSRPYDDDTVLHAFLLMLKRDCGTGRPGAPGYVCGAEARGLALERGGTALTAVVPGGLPCPLPLWAREWYTI